MIKTVMMAAVLCVFLFFIFGLYRVSYASMSDRVKEGDLLIYYRLEKDYKQEDVVIYEKDGNREVSAIVAMPGDLVSIDKNGNIVVNSMVVAENDNLDVKKAKYGCAFPYRVQEGEVFVLNEDLRDMNDSRTYCGINESLLRGKVIGVFRTRSI